MKIFNSRSEAETFEIASEFARKLKPNDVVAFFGGMGMGKTAFIKAAVKALGVSADATSPTFSIVNDYGGDVHIYHFDMYRVESWESLYSTGFFDYLDSGGILFIEWSENIENALPENAVHVEILPSDGENHRLIKISGGDGRW
ncbi:MAG: tRNA (adenosine(37)-N6)-threonylcarbamoyltransferase complex ATPase subunit type 1 TsaE [Clostridiales bacterium]|nr:tRNA (adenosine(37)-N6)-threonylcarbamoyltransferase complex ATPase subunit type 1 TsaE [Clostridiales bacterium]